MPPRGIPSYFDKIALCLPGGGYRAAGFSLGILSLLEDCGLLPQVYAISTVSGGTITGAKYAQMMADGKSFDDFYNVLYDWLKKDTVVTDALSDLKDPKKFRFNNKESNPTKSVNLINAFALQYSKFIPGTFGEIDEKLQERYGREGSGLVNVCFNATDFEHGLQFRFRNDGVCGNNMFTIKKPQQGLIKLGDIVAASSCFPGGFEPIVYPDDFFPYDPEKLKRVALMDGGIIDNQGSSSFTTSPYTDKTKQHLKYSCYLVADAGNFRIEGYNPTQPSWKTTLISIAFSFWTTIILTLSTAAAFHYNQIELIFGVGCLLVISILVQSVLAFGLHYAKSISGIPVKIPRHNLGIYLANRFNSVMLLNSSIFLKGSKAKNLGYLFDIASKETSKLSIYQLFHDKKKDKPYWQNENLWQDVLSLIGPIPDCIQKSSERSTTFDTTLWFHEKAKTDRTLDHLILTGRAVACFSLIHHIIDNSSSKSAASKTVLMKRLIKLFKNLDINSIPLTRSSHV